jgi:hypothetical protein
VISRERQTLAAILLCVAISCIHIGANEYFSVQFLAFSLSAISVWPWYFKQLTRLCILAAVLMAVIAASYVLAQHDSMTLLKGIRSVIVLLVLAAWQQRLREGGTEFAPIVRRAILFACVVSLALAVAQFVDSMTVNSGFLELPKSFYGIQYGTLLAERREMGLFSRPSALFSEPSALGALGVLAVAVSFITSTSLLRVLGFAIVITSQSLSGLVLAMGISLFSVNWRNSKALLAVALVAAAGFAFLVLGSAGERILLVLTATDLSARIRLFEPILVLNDMFASGLYFGGSPDHLFSLTSPDVSTIFDNWFINQFLLYGVLGFFWISASLISVRASLWPLLAAYMVTNGDALYYDRYFLLLIAMTAIADVEFKKTDDFNRNGHIQ